MKLEIEARGGGCYGGNWASLNSMRFFAVIRDEMGNKVAEREVTIDNGIVKPKEQEGEEICAS